MAHGGIVCLFGLHEFVAIVVQQLKMFYCIERENLVVFECFNSLCQAKFAQ